MDPPASQPPTRKFSEKRKNLSTSRDHRPRISKRQKKLQSESKSKTLIPKIHSKPKCSGKLVACQSSKQKKLKSERKQRETRGVYGGRRWTVSPKNSSVHKDRVVVVSYNILGVENALKLPELYHQVPPEFLDWNHRKKTICKEITYYHPSIVCFQEVDRFEELNYILQEDGFKGIYKGRTGEACDGCAIFWRHDLFTLLHQENIEFKMFDLRDNVAQLCVLEMNETNKHSGIHTDASKAPKERRLLVGNIHVLFNPKRGDIKLGQVRMFIEKAHQLSQTWGDIPIILSGDFNSQPKSAMYQFLSASELDIQLNDRRNISGQPGCSTQWRTAQSVQYNRNGFWKSISKPLLYDWSREELYSATGCEQITHLRHRLNISSAYAGIPSGATV
uniref:Endonuclease/exonuclease/phosphatase domain-containing protein n=1 Tax=Kalanchoe fedtschenkoi TaxID=63787 RepID=A0A7N0VH61_KALFE